MQGIPPAAQAAGPQLRLVAHCEQQPSQRIPGGRGQTALDPADRCLRGAGAERERALTEAEPLAVLTDDATGIDIEKYIGKRGWSVEQPIFDVWKVAVERLGLIE
jgi:hypothetical protein